MELLVTCIKFTILDSSKEHMKVTHKNETQVSWPAAVPWGFFVSQVTLIDSVLPFICSFELSWYPWVNFIQVTKGH